jgi:hypothetical protein
MDLIKKAAYRGNLNAVDAPKTRADGSFFLLINEQLTTDDRLLTTGL